MKPLKALKVEMTEIDEFSDDAGHTTEPYLSPIGKEGPK